MRKKDVTKAVGRAARTAGKVAGRAALKVAGKAGKVAGKVAGKKGKIGLAAAGVVLVAGAVALARKKRARGKRSEGTAESARKIPVSADADLSPRGDGRKGTMPDAPVAGARFNDVRDEPKDGR